MNQVALVGNITDDPELRYTQSGGALGNFTVAVSHRSKTNGEWQDVSDGFFRCTTWRSVAENAAKSLKKGDRVFVAGKLVQRTWEKDGVKRQTVEVQVTSVGPDLQFATAEVAKSTADGSRPLRRSPGNRTPAHQEPGFGRAPFASRSVAEDDFYDAPVLQGCEALGQVVKRAIALHVL